MDLSLVEVEIHVIKGVDAREALVDRLSPQDK